MNLRTLGAAIAGAATVFGFAPFGLAALPILTVAFLFSLWQKADSPRAAASFGLAFGLGLFGAGASWVYIALNTFGGMPLPVAATATLGFCAYLALFPAAAGWLAARWTGQASLPRALAAASLWTLAEWARSFVFTGFGWLSLGYAELPDGTPGLLSGFAPIGGVFLVSFAVALCAAFAAFAFDALSNHAHVRAFAAIAAALAIVATAGAVGRIEWTVPAGAPLEVSLVQGNVTQDLKFDPRFRDSTYRLYLDLVAQTRGRLIVLPESAFPTFADEVPDAVLKSLQDTAAARNGDVIVGMFTTGAPLPGHDEPRYYNSVLSMGTGDIQLYRKRHLVPFGETIPLESVIGWFIRSVLAIPIASQSSGDPDQPPIAAAGQRVAVNICYEDAFGADIRPQAAAATLLVNVTNDAWYGRSLAAEQHNQIAAMRALETGRPLLRATNTGITSAIGHDGRELARLPWFTRGILEIELAGRTGITPYVRFGDAVPAALAALLLGVALAAARRGSGGYWRPR